VKLDYNMTKSITNQCRTSWKTMPSWLFNRLVHLNGIGIYFMVYCQAAR